MVILVARGDVLLNVLGLLLLLISFTFPGSGASTELFGVWVPDTVLLPGWMVVSLALLWWKPHGWVPIAKLLGDLLLVFFAYIFIQFSSSTFLGSPGLGATGATVAYAAVVIFMSGAVWGAALAFRSIRVSRRLAI